MADLRKNSSQTDNLFGVDISQGLNSVLKQAGKHLTKSLPPSLNRLANAGLSVGGRGNVPTPVRAQFSNEDWRVRLSLPDNGIMYHDVNNSIMAPLRNTNGMIFPYTPQIMIGHTANYGQQQPTHSNYAQYFYSNSSVDQITITGEFTAQNQSEARYVVAALTFMRSVTKMFFGDEDYAGTPPPILRLNGYGDHIFSNVPVVVTNFTFELSGEVDYINAEINSSFESFTEEHGTFYRDKLSPTRVPTNSSVSVTVVPIYSRSQISNDFTLKEFAAGGLLGNKQSGKGGFI